MSERDPFSVYRSVLDAAGFRPSRRLGQNFLLQPELHRVIAEAAKIAPSDVVLEIGAGLGFLTRELAVRARRVVAVEIDARLVDVLRQEIARMPEGHRVLLVHGDILAKGGRLAPAVLDALGLEAQGLEPAGLGARGFGVPGAEGGSLRVVANLPYAITGPLLAALCTSRFVPAGVAMLLQREAADRLTAAPGQREWGSLSALVQACFRVQLVRRVGREVFRPRPNVDSSIVALDRLPTEEILWAESDRISLAAFVRALFAGRRKKARHRLGAAAVAGGMAVPDPLPGWPVLEARPADLGVRELIALWRALRAGS